MGLTPTSHSFTPVVIGERVPACPGPHRAHGRPAHLGSARAVTRALHYVPALAPCRIPPYHSHPQAARRLIVHCSLSDCSFSARADSVSLHCRTRQAHTHARRKHTHTHRTRWKAFKTQGVHSTHTYESSPARSPPPHCHLSTATSALPPQHCHLSTATSALPPPHF